MRTYAIVIGLVLALAAQAHAAVYVVDNTTVSVIGGSSAYPGYPQGDAIDVGLNRYLSDYASNGAGVNTFLDLQFSEPTTFTQIVFTDRTSSGGGNNSGSYGILDYVTQYQYIFATDAAFTNIVGTVLSPVLTPPGSGPYENFQSTLVIPNITAQYVRWEVVSTSGANPGAADFEFTAVTPEPASMVIWGGFGLVGLAAAYRRKRRVAVPSGDAVLA